MPNEPVTFEEHVDCLKSQSKSTLRALRVEADLLERFLAGDRVDPHQVDQLRSQGRATLSTLRRTNQLLAQAAQLQESTQPQEAETDERHRRNSVRLG